MSGDCYDDERSTWKELLAEGVAMTRAAFPPDAAGCEHSSIGACNECWDREGPCGVCDGRGCDDPEGCP